MQLSAIAAAAATFLAGSLYAADAGLLKLVMPDARIVAGLNVEQVKLSPFGQYMLTRMQGSEGGPMQMLQGTGFDPRRDLREILLASDGKQGNAGLVLTRGAFNIPGILEAARSQGAQIGTYGGVQTLGGKEPDGLLAFPDATLAIMGDAASVHAAIDRRAGGAALPADLVERVTALSATEDFWFVSLVPPSQIPIEQAPALAMLKKVQQATGGVKFGASVVLSLQMTAATEKDAGDLMSIFKMLAGMAQMGAKKSQEPAAASLLRDMVVTAEGNVMKLSLSVPEDKLEAMFK